MPTYNQQRINTDAWKRRLKGKKSQRTCFKNAYV